MVRRDPNFENQQSRIYEKFLQFFLSKKSQDRTNMAQESSKSFRLNYYSIFEISWFKENRIFDFHKRKVVVMNATFWRLKPKIIYYRDNKMLYNVSFLEYLLVNLSLEKISRSYVVWESL